MSEPNVFVLVLSYNGIKWLKDCLPSIFDMDYQNFETVVIDNGSSDGTQDFLREFFPQVQVIALQQNRGYAGGFNAGLEYAAQRDAEYFLIMNNDVEIDTHALSALVEVAKTDVKAGFVTGKVYYFDRRDVIQTVGRREDPITWAGTHIGADEKDIGQYDQIKERLFADDIYTLVSRKMYDEIGGYDPQFFLHCEEFDWQLRAKKAGWKIFYTPQARLWHRGSATTGGAGSPINNYFLERSRMIVIAKHGNRNRLSRYFFWSMTQALYRLAGSVLHLNKITLKARLARIFGLLSGLCWLFHRKPATSVPWSIEQLSRDLVQTR